MKTFALYKMNRWHAYIINILYTYSMSGFRLQVSTRVFVWKSVHNISFDSQDRTCYETQCSVNDHIYICWTRMPRRVITSLLLPDRTIGKPVGIFCERITNSWGEKKKSLSKIKIVQLLDVQNTSAARQSCIGGVYFNIKRWFTKISG